MNFLASYGLFLAKFATALILLLIFILIVISAKTKQKTPGKISISNINKKYTDMQHTLQKEIIDDKLFKKQIKQENKAQKKQKNDKKKNKIFLVNFNGDIKATQVKQLREIITGILLVATPEDEVVINLESPGGLVHSYGLAASQLQRLRTRNIPLTVTVDKVAASGGYMMACVANKIIAAPFAIIGSIGVLVQLPNFNRLLKHNKIDFEQLSAGDYKRTLTIFGENTQKDRKKMQEDIEETHVLFKDFIKTNRAILDVDAVANGEYWLGTKALQLRLVDMISTSDDYLLDAKDKYDIFEVKFKHRKSLTDKISKGTAKILDRVIMRLSQPEG
ncbi:MAG: protease SohB [Legionellales bacterium]|nr:protease SohB [Legionellales bacterium]